MTNITKKDIMKEYKGDLIENREKVLGYIFETITAHSEKFYPNNVGFIELFQHKKYILNDTVFYNEALKSHGFCLDIGHNNHKTNIIFVKFYTKENVFQYFLKTIREFFDV